MTSIAIVGMGGVFAGAPDLETFWEAIRSGRDLSSEATETRWGLDPGSIQQPWPPAPDRVYGIRGYYIHDFRPDPTGLDLDPGLFDGLDSSCHLVLHAGRQAFASCVTDGLNRSKAGVILGQIALPTEAATALALRAIDQRMADLRPDWSPRIVPNDAHMSFAPLTRRVTGLPAALLAGALGLTAGGFTLDAACASSLYAVKLACDELLAGRSDLMLAGGLARPDSLYTQMGFSQLRALSVSGRCSPFDSRGDGLVVGEGAGVVALKRLDDALQDGDRIHGVIRGWGLSNDLEGNLLAPAKEGQLRAMKPAYRMAGWRPWEVDLVECHATGTPVGDRVEFDSLKALWQDAPSRPEKCVLGSVKSTVGHLLTGAGAASLIKVLLAIEHQTLPPTANFRTPHPGMGMEASPFEVLSRARSWGADGPRKAAVSGFGFGGTNAHLLVEEWRGQPLDRKVFPAGKASPREAVAIVGLAASVGPWEDLAALSKRWFTGSDDTEPDRRPNGWGLDRRLPPGYYKPLVDVPIGRFRIPPSEMADMLPQQAQMLLTAADALGDAGFSPDPGRLAGAFIGLALDPNTTNYQFRWSLEREAREWLRQNASSSETFVQEAKDAAGPPLTADRTLGALGSIVASRIAREFRMAGPSFTVSSDETSGLSALAPAFRALQAGELDLALVGAVDFQGDVRTLSEKDWEERAFRPSEGAAAMILKRLSDAEKDGDRIYGLISGIGHVGGPASVGSALEKACREADMDPGRIDFLEWDTAECRANRFPEAVFRPGAAGSSEGPPPVLGCAAFDTGQTGAADGLVSLVRTVRALRERRLPASPPGDLSGMARQPRPGYWLKNRIDGPRTAAVSSVNADGGTVAVVLQEYPARQDEPVRVGIENTMVPEDALYVVEGNDRTDIVQGLKTLKNRSGNDGRFRFGRSGGELTLALVPGENAPLSDTIDRAVSLLESGVDRIEEENLFFESAPLGGSGDMSFVFPGSGNHFPGMGLDIGRHWPEVFERLIPVNERLRDQFAADHFWLDGDAALDHRALISGQVAVGTAVYDVVTGYGLKPRAVIGHSLGETASLFATGTWTARDEMLRRMEASTLFTHDLAGECRAVREVWGLSPHEPVKWVTGLVGCPPDRIRPLLPQYPRVYLQIVNSPEECMIGGDEASLRALVGRLDCLFVPVEGVTTVHCEAVGPVRDAYRKLHLFDTTPPEGIRIHSAAWGKPYRPDRETAADSITDQAMTTMDFPRLIERAYQDGVRLFLEMGPGGSCTRMISRILNGRPHAARPVYLAGRDVRLSVRQALAWATAHRVLFDLPDWEKSGERLEPAEVEPKRPSIVIATGREDFKLPAPPSPKKADSVDPAPGGPQVAPATGTPSVPHHDTPGRLTAARSLEPLIQGLGEAQKARAEAHQVFLRMSDQTTRSLTENLLYQMKLSEKLLSGQVDPDSILPPAPPEEPVPPLAKAEPPLEKAEQIEAAPFMDRRQCLEYAVGSIGRVLGEKYADIDRFPTRVRLPDEPLMLVDRIMSVEGDPLSLTSGRVVTRHDVIENGWYLDNGRIPTCIAIEAGQADLFLSGYLGIDYQTKGLAVYRLLDAEVTFQGPLPGPGEVITYDIHIDRFFRHGETYLFRFRFDAAVDGRPLMIMRNGCAGFFSPGELASGKGLLASDLDVKAAARSLPDDWADLVQTRLTSLDNGQVQALYDGDLGGCLGDAFGNLALDRPLTLPSGPMKLIDRVLHLDPHGGRYGLGVIKTEMDIHPDDWFLTCHFVDDMVMPGTLMYECCLHSLRLFLLSLGWVGEKEEVVCEPLPDVTSKLKCRGQITPSSKKAAYEIFIKELGYDPAPYAIADGIMYADGRPVVHVEDMTIQLTGLTREKLIRQWGMDGAGSVPQEPVFTHGQVLTFAEGLPSEAFGAPYQPFDRDRFIARLPRPPYSFIDRIVRVKDAEPFQMKAGALAVAEYDPPADAWYFRDNNGTMPYSILLEIALQPCGWMSAYSGSALCSDADLHFRNLGGAAVQQAAVVPGSGPLTTEAQMTKVSRSGDMIIQHYRFRVSGGGQTVYEGTTYFGFFTKESLANQLGIQDDGGPLIPESELSSPVPFPEKPYLPRGMIRMMDDITHLSDHGGPHGLGAVAGRKLVNPEEWFFQAHFYQDPVWPGSLGVEAFLQLLQVPAAGRWSLDESNRFQATVPGIPHEWIYRGQVVPTNREVVVEAAIKHIDDENRIITADGLLKVDGMTIYHMKDFSVKAV